MNNPNSYNHDLVKPFLIVPFRIEGDNVEAGEENTEKLIEPFVVQEGALVKPFVCIEDVIKTSNLAMVQSVVDSCKGKQPHIITDVDECPFDSGSVIQKPDGFYLKRKQDKVKISNFLLIPVRLIRDSYIDHQDIRIELELVVNTRRMMPNIQVLSGDIETVISRIQKAHPACWITESVKRNAGLIIEHIRKQLDSIPKYTCYKQVGWQQYHKQRLYMHDGLAGKLDEYSIIETGKTLISNVSSFREACKGAYAVLNLSDDPSKIVPIFLFAHLSLMWSVFKEAGHTPQFLLFINGTSGALKTAVSKAVFIYFNSDNPEAPASFKGTSASLEVKMNQAIDSVLLVDDFHPATTFQERNELRFILERVIRFFGDSIGRSRCNVDMSLKETYEPHGMCVLTGEDTAGTESTLLRCVNIEVSKGTFNGEALAVLQKNPLVWSSHLAHFVDYVGKNYYSIQDLIKNSFPALRQRYGEILKGANRLIDSAVFLIITARVLIEYFKCYDSQNKYASEETFLEWERAVLAAMTASKRLSHEASPALLFAEAVSQLYASGQIGLATDKEEYQAKKDSFVGFKDDDRWWLCPSLIFSAVRKYWTGLGKSFVISQSVLFKDLNTKGLIYVENEKRKNGEEKKYYTLKSSFGNRARFLVISSPAMEQFLANEE